MRPCRKDLCLLYSLGVDYAKLMDFTNENPQGILFRRAERAIIYNRRITALWYGYDTGMLIESVLRRILKRSITYCNLMKKLGVESEFCRRFTYYDEVQCENISEYDVDVAYADITHMIADYNNETASEIFTKMIKECSTYEVR